MLDRIERTVPNPAAQATPQITQAAKIPHPPSIQELVADIQEEISFAHSEKTQEKNINEFEVEDHGTHILEQLIARVEEENAPGDPSNQDKKDTLERALTAGQNQEELEETLQNLTPDKSEAFSLLAYLSQKTLYPEAKAHLENFMQSYVDRYEPQITAGFNTAALAKKTAKNSHVPQSTLQHTYQDAVTSYEGILPTLLKIIEASSVEGFEDNAQFLMQAAQVDLASERSSVQPERLKRILSELQGLKIFNTLKEALQKIIQRLKTQYPQAQTLHTNPWLSHTLHHIQEPTRFEDTVNKHAAALPPAPKVLFLQELRNLMRALPSYLFSAPTEKKRILFPIQREIDNLIFKKGA